MYEIDLLGVRMLAVLPSSFDHRKTIAGGARVARHGANRVGEARTRCNRNNPADGKLRGRDWVAHFDALPGKEGLGKSGGRISQ